MIFQHHIKLKWTKKASLVPVDAPAKIKVTSVEYFYGFSTLWKVWKCTYKKVLKNVDENPKSKQQNDFCIKNTPHAIGKMRKIIEYKVLNYLTKVCYSSSSQK